MRQGSVLDIKGFDEKNKYAVKDDLMPIAAEDEVVYKSAAQLDKVITQTKKAMEKAAKELDFMEAARLRDELLRFQKEKEMSTKLCPDREKNGQKDHAAQMGHLR